MATFDLTHARHDPAHCLAPGLFRSLRRGERIKSKLDITYEYGEKETIRFIGYEPLGADDLRALQGLVALGGPDGLILGPEPEAEFGQQLRLFLEPKAEAVKQNAMLCRSTMRHLLAEVGLNGAGTNIAALRESLLRLSSVTIIARKGRREASFKLLSYGYDDDTGELLVALNPRLCNAILGKAGDGSRHVTISMAEVRALKSDPARLIHQRLSAWIDAGSSHPVTLDTVCGYVWPNEAPSADAMKKRRQTARKALKELVEMGWKVDEYAPAKFKIGRPAGQPAL